MGSAHQHRTELSYHCCARTSLETRSLGTIMIVPQHMPVKSSVIKRALSERLRMAQTRLDRVPEIPCSTPGGSLEHGEPRGTHLSRGQFCPRAFRMASVMLEQPEAHKDCNLWHPLHIVMRPSSVICYKKNNNNITSHNDAGGGARHRVLPCSDFQPGTSPTPSYASFNPKTHSTISLEQLKQDKPHGSDL